MKIIEARAYTEHKGFANQYESVRILVDEFPLLRYREIRTEEGEVFFYAETDGFVNCYQYVEGSTQGFGGRTIRLTMEDGTTRDFKGQLWNSYLRHHRKEIPLHKEISGTDNRKTWERGFTFYAISVTLELYDRLMAEVSGQTPKADHGQICSRVEEV